MNRRIKRVGPLLLAGCLGLVLATSGWAGTLTVRADEWCPYNCEVGAVKPGYMIEVLNLIFGQGGDKVDYQTLNWARSIEETRDGKFNAIVGAAVSDAEDFVYPRNSFGLSANGFCVRTGEKWSYAGPASFAGKVLGVIRDYSYDDEDIDGYIEENKKDAAKVQVASGDKALETNLKKLVKGRVDVVVDDFAVLRRSKKDLGLADQLSCVSDSDPDPIFVAFSPKDPQAKANAERFDKGIVKLRKEGTLDKILAGYGLEDWQ